MVDHSESPGSRKNRILFLIPRAPADVEARPDGRVRLITITSVLFPRSFCVASSRFICSRHGEHHEAENVIIVDVPTRLGDVTSAPAESLSVNDAMGLSSSSGVAREALRRMEKNPATPAASMSTASMMTRFFLLIFTMRTLEHAHWMCRVSFIAD